MSDPDVHNTVEISTKGKMTTLKPITSKADQTNGTLEHYPASPFL
jgi:hypothetical protein